ncbi:helix-turn-helix transcriptional regulator [Qipengyuania sphaerica]|uniref:helix-turn-helix transcriptional regulator n=1 Tax=Qipengyuania sphaerica TaxID=2867243 RepID=UPI001C86E4F5|nr:LuxR family transcriptional regulator [Qipengyuania sphaerica]MBX7539662.1 AAA family ATPase [Qipengyuania sphaerica]
MILGHGFVGRSAEFDQFESLLDGLNEGSGETLVVSGSAGIGKTALVNHFRHLAEDRGAMTCWVGFPEQSDCPPFWGWIEVCRQLDATGCAPEAMALVDAMTQSEVRSTSRSQPLIFDRLLRLLREAAASHPLALFFDDIQYSDIASAKLLDIVASEVRHHPILIVITFRDGETQPSIGRGRPARQSTLALRAQRMVLRGMDQLESAQFCRELASWTPEAQIIRRLHRQTEGNPLFLRQIVQSLLDQGHIADGVAVLPDRITVPEGITEAIAIRLEQVSHRCQQTLMNAAILGRTFEQLVLMRLDTEFHPRLLDEAAKCGLARPTEAALGRWEFNHALIREVLYDRLAPIQRLRAHADAAAAIEAVYGSENPHSLSALAYHAFEGQIFVGAQRVIELARKAAKHAMSVTAYDDAAAQFRLALECFSVPGIDNVTGKIDVALELAEAERSAGDNLAAIRTAREAAGWARSSGDWPRFAAATLQYEAARWQPGLPSEESIEHLELALNHAEEIPDETVVQLHCSLARAIQWSGRLEAAREQGLRAIEMARELGDQALLCDALDQGTCAFNTLPGSVDLRLSVCREAVAIARKLEDKFRLATMLVDFGSCSAQVGNFESLRETHLELRGLARELAQPHFQYVSQHWETTLAMLEGDLAEAIRSASAALAIGRKISGANAQGVYGMQMFLIERERGALQQVAGLARSLGKDAEQNIWRPGYMLLLAEIDELDAARIQLDDILKGGLNAIPKDDLFILTLAFMAETIWHTRTSAPCEHIFSMMEAESGNAIISGPASLCFGPVDRALGQLLASMGRFADAKELFERALQQAESWDSKPMILRVACDYCDVLLVEGTPTGIKRARDLEAKFAGLAHSAGMASLVNRFTRISATLRKLGCSHGFDELTAREVEVLREIAAGASNAEISRNLGITLPTVATHVRNILGKTESKNRTAAAAYARHVGLAGFDADR